MNASHKPVTSRSACWPVSGGALLYAATLILTLGLTACANMSGIAPQARLRDGVALGLPSAATGTPDAFDDIAISADWWRGFGDAKLDQLVDQALADSPNLKVAEARVVRAASVADISRAADGPQLNGSVDFTRQRFSGNGLYPPPIAGSILNTGAARVSGSWEIDFFGKNRAALDAALGSARAAHADAQAARVLLSCNVARAYLRLAQQNALLDVAERTLAQRKETLTLVRDRVEAGLDTRLEQLQSEGGLPEALQHIEALREQMALSRNTIAALIGAPQAADSIYAADLRHLRGLTVPDTLPADLMGRRADIAAARWRVEAASNDIQVAKAQFYPNLNLSAFVGLSSIGLSRFARGGSEEYGVGPAIRLPIFDSGRLRAGLRGRTADFDAAVESYNSSLIDAVHDVRDQLASTRSILLQQAQQADAQAAAESAYDIAVQRYRAGLGTYLNVLSAETTVLQQRRQAVDLTARRFDTQVGLVRALGGGYRSDAAPTAAASHAAAATDVAVTHP